MRHTAGSYLAIAGVSERYIAEILGYKTLEMVKRYTHLKPEHLRDAMNVLGTISNTVRLKQNADYNILAGLEKEYQKRTDRLYAKARDKFKD